MTRLKGDKPKKMAWERKADKGRTKLSQDGFYNTARWRKVRDYVIINEPLCRRCLSEWGRRKPADMVDHIEPINEDSSDELKFGLENLQPLCFTCHSVKTRIDGSKNSEANLKRGRDLMRDLES